MKMKMKMKWHYMKLKWKWNERKNEWTNEWMNERGNERMSESTNERTNERTNRRTDGRTNPPTPGGWVRERNRVHGSCYCLTFFFRIRKRLLNYFDVVFVQSESSVKRRPGPLNLGDAVLDLVFFKSESNVRHRPCPWFGAFGHLLAGCSGVVRARFFASWGCHFWTLFSSNQKATLSTGRVHGSGPSGTSWHGVLVW